jgi:hypothetical protein
MTPTLRDDPTDQGRNFDYNRFVEFVRNEVQPPARVYVTRDDRLVMRLWAPIAAIAWRISIRWQGPDGRIIPQFLNGSQSTTGATPATIVLSSAEGYLLSATIETSTTTVSSSYVSLELIRGAGTSDLTRGQVLICGNLGITGCLSFPQTPNTTPYSLRGALRTITVTPSGAGFDILQLVPAGVTWVIKSISMRFTADANVANRNLSLNIADSGGTTILQVPLNAPLTAGSVTSVTYAGDVQPLVIVGFAASAPMPLDFRVGPAFFILTATQNIQVGDAYTAIRICAEEFVNF